MRLEQMVAAPGLMPDIGRQAVGDQARILEAVAADVGIDLIQVLRAELSGLGVVQGHVAEVLAAHQPEKDARLHLLGVIPAVEMKGAPVLAPQPQAGVRHRPIAVVLLIDRVRHAQLRIEQIEPQLAAAVDRDVGVQAKALHRIRVPAYEIIEIGLRVPAQAPARRAARAEPQLRLRAEGTLDHAGLFLDGLVMGDRQAVTVAAVVVREARLLGVVPPRGRQAREEIIGVVVVGQPGRAQLEAPVLAERPLLLDVVAPARALGALVADQAQGGRPLRGGKQPAAVDPGQHPAAVDQLRAQQGVVVRREVQVERLPDVVLAARAHQYLRGQKAAAALLDQARAEPRQMHHRQVEHPQGRGLGAQHIVIADADRAGRQQPIRIVGHAAGVARVLHVVLLRAQLDAPGGDRTALPGHRHDDVHGEALLFRERVLHGARLEFITLLILIAESVLDLEQLLLEQELHAPGAQLLPAGRGELDLARGRYLPERRIVRQRVGPQLVAGTVGEHRALLGHHPAVDAVEAQRIGLELDVAIGEDRAGRAHLGSVGPGDRIGLDLQLVQRGLRLREGRRQ